MRETFWGIVVLLAAASSKVNSIKQEFQENCYDSDDCEKKLECSTTTGMCVHMAGGWCRDDYKCADGLYCMRSDGTHFEAHSVLPSSDKDWGICNFCLNDTTHWIIKNVLRNWRRITQQQLSFKAGATPNPNVSEINSQNNTKTKWANSWWARYPIRLLYFLFSLTGTIDHLLCSVVADLRRWLES